MAFPVHLNFRISSPDFSIFAKCHTRCFCDPLGNDRHPSLSIGMLEIFGVTRGGAEWSYLAFVAQFQHF